MTPSYTTHTNSKWLKVLTARHAITIPVEENIGKTFSDINCTTVFLGQSPKTIEIKAKINKWGLIKPTRFCITRGTINKMKRHLLNWRKYLQMISFVSHD
jgi:hypothetical protein